MISFRFELYIALFYYALGIFCFVFAGIISIVFGIISTLLVFGSALLHKNYT